MRILLIVLTLALLITTFGCNYQTLSFENPSIQAQNQQRLVGSTNPNDEWLYATQGSNKSKSRRSSGGYPGNGGAN